MTDKQNFEKDIDVPSKRPPYEIALMHDHILRLEEELKAKEQECEELRNQWEFSVAHKIILEKDYNVELNKLKQALTEIKEIAEKQYHTKLVDKDCINCDESFAQILQKCEVLDV